MAKYAVRGAVPARAGELQAQLKAGEKLPFERLAPRMRGGCGGIEWLEEVY